MPRVDEPATDQPLLLQRIQRTVLDATRWTAFEPNDQPLWTMVQRTVSGVLFNFHERGDLKGDRRDEAYFVRCDTRTMTQEDIENGRLVIEIGVALSQPAEFVTFRIRQTAGKSAPDE
jgi:phage tail sheath protein FI